LSKGAYALTHEQNVRYQEKARYAALSHYGPNGVAKCSWPGCEICDTDMLVVGHGNGQGKADRLKRTGHSLGWRLCVALRREGYPSGYHTICENHNRKEERERLRKFWIEKNSTAQCA
jgi:hypothetical protein